MEMDPPALDDVVDLTMEPGLGQQLQQKQQPPQNSSLPQKQHHATVQQIQSLNNTPGDTNKFTTTSVRGNKIKLDCADMGTYHRVLAKLDVDKRQMHTHQLRRERGYRIILRNLHHSTPCEWIRKHIGHVASYRGCEEFKRAQAKLQSYRAHIAIGSQKRTNWQHQTSNNSGRWNATNNSFRWQQQHHNLPKSQKSPPQEAKNNSQPATSRQNTNRVANGQLFSNPFRSNAKQPHGQHGVSFQGQQEQQQHRGSQKTTPTSPQRQHNNSQQPTTSRNAKSTNTAPNRQHLSKHMQQSDVKQGNSDNISRPPLTPRGHQQQQHREPQTPKQQHHQQLGASNGIDQLMQVVSQNLLVFGFRRHHSTEQQLARVTQYILDSYEKRLFCSAVFIDVSEAFDRVWHSGLLLKLAKLLPFAYYQVLESYLTDRSFVVNGQNGVRSRSGRICAGVPQGSVLGPVLYTVFTSDMPLPHLAGQNDGRESDFFKDMLLSTYADDTIILCARSLANTAVRTNEIYLKSFTSWASKWGINLNKDKTIHSPLLRPDNGQEAGPACTCILPGE
ncbi:putative mediator of RNA polymerase II transcription subunit 26 [Drosophila obscura]|uniref:putative mediator of RNA polymerase II transcription subunit 26 n=1 Tax=Drosophila obscura TaxID=7282 RepID=UPI001BB1B23D|nr:putative mediator of RNA polymerase II transcription subunit 26 [Drosophila obscura]